MAYIPLQIDADPPELADEAFAYLEERVPGWEPSPGNLEAWLIEALAQLAGELRELTTLVPEAIFEYFGTTILGLPPHPAMFATGSTSWTARDEDGYTVDAGTLVAVEPPADPDNYTFEVTDSFTIPAGSLSATGIQIRALEEGAASSGITGPVEVLDPLDFVDSVTLDGYTAGGVDAEPIEDYLARLSGLLVLLTPRPILPQDFATMALEVAGVARATAIDLYNLDTGQTDVPRCVTVIVVGPDGRPVSPTTREAVRVFLQARREVNFLVFVGDPDYETIDVEFTATSFPGWDASEVEARAVEAITEYLSPQAWGQPGAGAQGGPETSWVNDNTVRFLEVSTVINNVAGINFITDLTLNGQHADVTMTGTAVLPEPGEITGTVTPG